MLGSDSKFVLKSEFVFGLRLGVRIMFSLK